MVLIDDNSRILTIGDALPPFVLPDARGGQVDSAVIEEPVLVVVFTCNHCPYAQKEEDGLIALQKATEPRVRFVLISSNDAGGYPDDSFEKMGKRAAAKGYPFAYCYDETQDAALDFGALCTPHCFVFDAKRRLAYKGGVSGVKGAVEDLLAGRAPADPERNAIGCSIKWKPGNEPPPVRA